jgi:hypothetical protein
VIAQQAPRPARRAIADAVIHNGGETTPDQLVRQAKALWRVWTGR